MYGNKLKISIIGFCLIAFLILLTGASQTEYPKAKPIEFIMPFGVGGSCDVTGRVISDAAENFLDQRIVPINKTGAGGAYTYIYVEKAKPDGYTIAWNSTSILTSTEIGNAPFDYTAFRNIARLQVTDMPLTVRADAPWANFNEFVEYINAHPGEVKIGQAGTGSATHLLSLAITLEAGIRENITTVPIGAKRRVPSLLGGELDAIVVPLPEIASQVSAGKARLLALPSPERNPTFPDVPTLKELGYDVSLQLFRGLSVPKGTPDDVVEVILEAFKKASESESYQKLAGKLGFRVAFMGEEEFQKYLAEQDKVVVKAMKAAGIHKSQK